MEASEKDDIVVVDAVEVDTFAPKISKRSLRLGTLVWGKLHPWPWWPGIIISHTDCALDFPTSPSTFWVFWFGQNTVSQVSRENLTDYLESFESCCAEGQGPQHNKGVEASVRAFAYENRPSISSADTRKLRQWAAAGFPGVNKPSATLSKYPNWLRLHLNHVRHLNIVRKKICQRKAVVAASEDNLAVSDSPEEDALLEPTDEDLAMVNRINQGTLDLMHFCLACHSEVLGETFEHPFFRGALCNECKEVLLKTVYAVGEDDIHVYCTVCGSTGDVLVCDSNTCCRVYCPYCVELLVRPGTRKSILLQCPWMCFLCQPFAVESHGLLQPWNQWQLKLYEFLHQDESASICRRFVRSRPRIRVLVLNDPLGSVYWALQSLNIVVDRYYTDELILEDLPEEVVVLSDCRSWDEENWRQISPVHLLVSSGRPVNRNATAVDEDDEIDPVAGGPSCRRVGRALFELRDYGEAFFDFHLIREHLRRVSGNNPLLWITENVQPYSVLISRYLESDPTLFDIRTPTSGTKTSLIWSNIPAKDVCLKYPIETPEKSESTNHYNDDFFEKFHWIAEDLEAINKPIPREFFLRNDQSNFIPPEVRSSARILKKKPKVLISSGSTSGSPKKKPKISPFVHKNIEAENLITYEKFIPVSFAAYLGLNSKVIDFVRSLKTEEAEELLNRTVPVELWEEILQPLKLLTF